MYYNDYNRFEGPVEPVVEPQTPKKKKTGRRTLALCLVCALIGGIAGGAGMGAATGMLFPDKAVIYESHRTPREAVARLLDRIDHPGPREVLNRPLSASLVIRESA